jgi:hypothetical protein
VCISKWEEAQRRKGGLVINFKKLLMYEKKITPQKQNGCPVDWG